MRANTTVKVAVLYSILAGSAFMSILLYEAGKLGWLCCEDGIVESLTAVFYFVAGALMFLACRRSGLRRCWLMLLGIGFILIAGEEISWGQRIFNIKTPHLLLENNVQHEFNLHNINGIHQHIRAVGVLGILIYCFILPVTDQFSRRLKGFYQKHAFPVFPLELTGVIIIAIVMAYLPKNCTT